MKLQVLRNTIVTISLSFSALAFADVRLYGERITCLSEFKCLDSPTPVGVVSTRSGDAFSSSSECRADLMDQLSASEACTAPYSLLGYEDIREFQGTCEYQWANYEAGQTFTTRTSSTYGTTTIHSDATQTVTSASPDEVTFEMTTITGSSEYSNSWSTTRTEFMSSCAATPTANPHVIDSGRETITVSAGTFDTTWKVYSNRIDSGSSTTKTWMGKVGSRGVDLVIRSESATFTGSFYVTSQTELLSYSGY